MIRALVVFESMFGNTQLIADAITEGLAKHLRAESVEVGRAPVTMPADVRLLVVGGPTHAFGMSRPKTRADAGAQAKQRVISNRIGVREWFAALPSARPDIVTATFSTRVKRPRMPGSAAKSAARRLQDLGYRAVAPPVDFWVLDLAGPLANGELERARAWGERLGLEVAAAVNA